MDKQNQVIQPVSHTALLKALMESLHQLKVATTIGVFHSSAHIRAVAAADLALEQARGFVAASEGGPAGEAPSEMRISDLEAWLAIQKQVHGNLLVGCQTSANDGETEILSPERLGVTTIRPDYLDETGEMFVTIGYQL